MTAEETRQRNIQAMGEQLGAIYSQLWQELAWLSHIWREYVTLFGTKPSRIALLNDVAPAFARVVQDSLWEGILLHIARLTDPAKTGKKPNLSIHALEDAVADEALKVGVLASVKRAKVASEFCRDWRNRYLAHRDLDLALKRGGEPLKEASRLKVREALDALTGVLDVISQHYLDAENDFRLGAHSVGGRSGAMSLLYYLDMGMGEEKCRIERRKGGNHDPNDYQRVDL